MTAALFKHFIPIPLICLLFAGCSNPAQTPARPTPPHSKTVRKSAFVLSVDLKAHTIVIDPMQFLTGAAAVKAYQLDNPGETEGPPNDYYIVNKKKEHVVLPFPKGAVVKLAGGSTGSTKGVVPQTKLVGYRGLGNQAFWITTQDGTVTEVEEQFTP